MSAHTYDVDKVLRGLIKKSSFPNDGPFDWSKFGTAVVAVFNKVPRVDFMSGPIGKPVVQKKVVLKEKGTRRKRQDEDGEEVRPEEMTTGKGGKADKHGLSGMENIIATFDKTLANKTNGGVGGDKDKGSGAASSRASQATTSLVSLVINPSSFTQTAENLLALSFQLKKGACRVSRDSHGLPIVSKVASQSEILGLGVGPRGGAASSGRGSAEDDDEDYDVANPTASNKHASKQSVLSINMRQWKELVEAYGVTPEDGMPHRASKREKREGV